MLLGRRKFVTNENRFYWIEEEKYFADACFHDLIFSNIFKRIDAQVYFSHADNKHSIMIESSCCFMFNLLWLLAVRSQEDLPAFKVLWTNTNARHLWLGIVALLMRLGLYFKNAGDQNMKLKVRRCRSEIKKGQKFLYIRFKTRHPQLLLRATVHLSNTILLESSMKTISS